MAALGAGVLQRGQQLGLAGGDAVAFALGGQLGRHRLLGDLVGLLPRLLGGVPLGGGQLGLLAGLGGGAFGLLGALAGRGGLLPGLLGAPLGRVALALRDGQLAGGLGPHLGDPPLHAGDAQLLGERLGEQVGGALQPLHHLPGGGDLPGQAGRVPAAFAPFARLAGAGAVVVLAVADGAHGPDRLRHRAAAVGARPDRDGVPHPRHGGVGAGLGRHGGGPGRGDRLLPTGAPGGALVAVPGGVVGGGVLGSGGGALGRLRAACLCDSGFGSHGLPPGTAVVALIAVRHEMNLTH